MDYWPGGVSGKCECGVHGECYDPSQVCHCDSGHDGWLQDGGDIHHKEDLPVRALHFGDTGTPLDNKEGRFRLGLLHCIGDRRAESETGPVRVQRVGDSQGHMAEVFFEFKTQEKGMVDLFFEEVDRDNYSKVKLVNARTIVYEWTSRGQEENITVHIGYNLNNGMWHSFNIERNILEVMVVVDLENIETMKNEQSIMEKNSQFHVTELEVFVYIFHQNFKVFHFSAEFPSSPHQGPPS